MMHDSLLNFRSVFFETPCITIFSNILYFNKQIYCTVLQQLSSHAYVICEHADSAISNIGNVGIVQRCRLQRRVGSKGLIPRRRNSLREIVSEKYGWLQMNNDSIELSHFFRFRRK